MEIFEEYRAETKQGMQIEETESIKNHNFSELGDVLDPPLFHQTSSSKYFSLKKL